MFSGFSMVLDSLNLSCCYSKLLFLSLKVEYLELGEHFLGFSKCFCFPEDRNNEGQNRTIHALDKSGSDCCIMPTQPNVFALMIHRWGHSTQPTCTFSYSNPAL